VRRVVQLLADARSLRYWPVAVLSLEPRWHGYALEGLPVFGGPELAPRLAECGIRVALVEARDERGSVLSWIQQYFRHVVIMQAYADLPVERVRVCNLGRMLGLEFTTNLLRWRNRVIKRTLGLIFGMIWYDTYYIRNWSLWLDPWILFRTVRAVLPGKGVR
jgi:hypothetical protein